MAVHWLLSQYNHGWRGGWLAKSEQSRQLQYLQETQFSYGHTEGDLRLCRSNEDGLSGIWNQAGSCAPSVSVRDSLIQETCKERGRSVLPLRYPTGGCSGQTAFSRSSFRQKARWFGPRWLLVVCLSRWWVDQSSQKLCFLS